MARFQRTLMILVRVLCALAVLASAGVCIMVFARFPLSYDKEALLATATPTTPQPKLITNQRSSMVLSTTVNIVAYIAWRGFPDALSTAFIPKYMWENTFPSNTITI